MATAAVEKKKGTEKNYIEGENTVAENISGGLLVVSDLRNPGTQQGLQLGVPGGKDHPLHYADLEDFATPAEIRRSEISRRLLRDGQVRFHPKGTVPPGKSLATDNPPTNFTGRANEFDEKRNALEDKTEREDQRTQKKEQRSRAPGNAPGHDESKVAGRSQAQG